MLVFFKFSLKTLFFPGFLGNRRMGLVSSCQDENLKNKT